jgi:subtilisin family serine protease
MRSGFFYKLQLAALLLLLNGSLVVVQAQRAAVSSVSSIDSVYHNWYNLDARQDKVHGVSVNRAYSELLNNKQSKKTIVVAVIDSGTDIEHEDLQGRIWINTKEIAGNGQDDDQNGYIDDVHGWGYLGNAQGEDIMYETYEYVRILRSLTPKYEQVQSIKELPASQHEEYRTYLQCRKNHEEAVAKRTKEKDMLDSFDKIMKGCQNIIAEHLGKTSFTLDEVASINSTNERVGKARNFLLSRYNNGYNQEEFDDYRKRNSVYLEQHLNLAYNPREVVTADNPEDIADRGYGNSNVTGPRADHGTPVSGIIAGVRGNGIGIEGIAENVKIMPIRAVPQGDEYDKDIALAIRYAVDNGAHIINMSFGKDFSPQKQFVDEAVKYAEQHNVLLVHAAGNDGRNIDKTANFPTKQLTDGTRAKNWLEVGATSMKADLGFCAVFSNYGAQNVDLFAPGVDIVSLAPENKYNKMDGTSFASPVVSGVAALVWSYYPELTAVELKEILLKSSTQYPKLKVYYPNLESAKKKKAKFSTLSGSGGVVNAYEALKLAEKVVQDKAPNS